jgi:hypothetical protein
VAVEVHGFAEGRILLASLEQIALRGFRRRAIAFADGFDDGARVNALVDVERNRRDLEGSVFGFARPDELRIEMGIVFLGFA